MADIAFFKRLITHPDIVIEDLEISQLEKNISKWQWDELENNLLRQRKSLFKTLRYSINNIGYYKKVAKETGFKFSEKNVYRDLQNFPILTKEIIRNNFDKLVDDKHIKRSRINSSGGTTGEPIKIYQHERNLKLINIINNLQYSWAGMKKGDMFVQLWGDESEIFKSGKNATGIIEINQNHYILNSFNMSDDKMKNYVDFINKTNPKLILAYVQSIFELSKFIQTNSLKLTCNPNIMTSAGTLYSFQKKTIEKVFKTKVFNRYGSREVHNIACDCESHQGLHLNTFFNYLEILDDDLKPVKKEGAKGKVYITTFENPVMPLIRYEIGDVATYTNKLCRCGRGLPIIKFVDGRIVDIFINSKGEKIDGEYFTHLFYLRESIEKFQVIQKSVNHVVVRFVPGIGYNKHRKKEFKEIEKKIKLVMGEKSKVSFEKVKNISPSKSGKIRYTISNI